jgi:ribosomal protein S18 acetylase RimI-like enzyme
MDIVIRPATIDDAADIARVHVAAWRTTYAGIVPDAYLDALNVDDRAQRWREGIASRNAGVLVAEDAAAVVGFAAGGKLREPIGDYDGELYAIYILRERQGQGIGRRLTQSVADVLRSEGFKSMAVWVLRKNPAVAFYRRLGAEEIAQKLIEIGGAKLEEIALGWPDIDRCFPADESSASPPAP